MPYRKRKETNQIIVHCAATVHGQKSHKPVGAGFRAIQRMHKGKLDARVPGGIGYHFVIEDSGAIIPGRPIEVIGAHARGHNSASIGICLMGGLDKSKRPSFRFSDEQFFSLRILTSALALRWGMYPDNIIGHRDTGANKDCPCFDVQHWYRTGELRNSTKREQLDFEAGVRRA